MNQTAARWADFDMLLGALAAAWESADAERAARLFTEDAVSWREYHDTGPADFGVFIADGGETWEWHAGNDP